MMPEKNMFRLKITAVTPSRIWVAVDAASQSVSGRGPLPGCLMSFTGKVAGVSRGFAAAVRSAAARWVMARPVEARLVAQCCVTRSDLKARPNNSRIERTPGARID